MNDLRQIGFGILAALLSASLVLGSLSLALTEDAQRVALLMSPTTSDVQAPTASPGLPPTMTIESTQATVTGISGTVTMTSSPTPTATPIICPIPPGWTIITLDRSITLETLAKELGLDEILLRQNNCLDGMLINVLNPGMTLYIPEPTATPMPSSTRPLVQYCSPPTGWVRYTIQRGDTLYSLSRALGTTVTQLMLANCLSSTLIKAGDTLYVPFLPVRATATPLPATATPIALTPTPITPTPVTPTPVTPQPTIEPTPPPTDEPTPPPTDEPSPPPTDEPTPPPTIVLTPPPTIELTPPPTIEPIPPPIDELTPPPTIRANF